MELKIQGGRESLDSRVISRFFPRENLVVLNERNRISRGSNKLFPTREKFLVFLFFPETIKICRKVDLSSQVEGKYTRITPNIESLFWHEDESILSLDGQKSMDPLVSKN